MLSSDSTKHESRQEAEVIPEDLDLGHERFGQAMQLAAERAIDVRIVTMLVILGDLAALLATEKIKHNLPRPAFALLGAKGMKISTSVNPSTNFLTCTLKSLLAFVMKLPIVDPTTHFSFLLGRSDVNRI